MLTQQFLRVRVSLCHSEILCQPLCKCDIGFFKNRLYDHISAFTQIRVFYLLYKICNSFFFWQSALHHNVLNIHEIDSVDLIGIC